MKDLDANLIIANAPDPVFVSVSDSRPDRRRPIARSAHRARAGDA